MYVACWTTAAHGLADIVGTVLPVEAYVYDGCTCGDTCSLTCPCLAGQSSSSSVLPSYQCGPKCSCHDHCDNRQVQTGVRLRLQVFRTEHRGWSLRTLEAIEPNTFVCEYAGELLSTAVAEARQAQYDHGNEGTYLFKVREHIARNGGTILRTNVDATLHGNAGRFINHSCSPNLFLHPVRCGSLVPTLALFSLITIEAGSELSFDYTGGEPSE